MSTTEHASPQSVKHRLSRGKLWCFRFATIAVALAFLGLLELSLRFCLPDVISSQPDLLTFEAVLPLFVLNKNQDRWEIPKSRLEYFVAESFPAKKLKDSYRIFCIGGSTVQGRPFSTETAFSKFLKIGLDQLAPEHDWQVINCGGVSYASYRLKPILKECLEHEADLIILCTGHNEFLEDRSYENARLSSPVSSGTLSAVSNLKMFQLAYAGAGWIRNEDSAQDAREILPAEVDALLDHQNGLEIYERDAQWSKSVVGHFELNVNQMIQECQMAQVPVILLTPPANLMDCPPFKSQSSDRLSEEQLRMRDDFVQKARHEFHRHSGPGNASNANAVKFLKEAIKIDTLNASLWYELGHCYLATHQIKEARNAFERARDEDVCPLRIRSSQIELLAHIAKKRSVPHIDLQTVLMKASGTEILGDSYLIDHVHPSIEGHQVIALELLETLKTQGFVELDSGWQVTAKKRFREHFDSLPSVYFAKGRMRLKNLQLWAAGRADGPIVKPKHGRN